MAPTTTKAKPPRKLVTLHKPGKTDAFAIGVSQEHYWLITAIAGAKGTNRMATLAKIIESYAKQHFADPEKAA